MGAAVAGTGESVATFGVGLSIALILVLSSTAGKASWDAESTAEAIGGVWVMATGGGTAEEVTTGAVTTGAVTFSGLTVGLGAGWGRAAGVT